MLKKLSERVDRMMQLQIDGKIGIRNKMRDKTDEVIQSLGEAVRRRESLDLAIIYQAIATRYQYT